MIDTNNSILFMSIIPPSKKEAMMKRIICTLTLATFSIVMATSIRAQTVYLPTCGTDPSVNTLAWQQKINGAAPGSTLVLPSGV